MAKAFGATVVAIDIDQGKLDAIAEHGAAITFNARDISGRDLKKAISAFAKENGLPITEWFIFVTMDKVEIRLSNLMAFHARVLGNWGCLSEHYPGALDLVLDGRIELKAFVEQKPLSDINNVFDAVHRQKMQRRAILVPDA